MVGQSLAMAPQLVDKTQRGLGTIGRDIEREFREVGFG
jgi:hypothetical protein